MLSLSQVAIFRRRGLMLPAVIVAVVVVVALVVVALSAVTGSSAGVGLLLAQPGGATGLTWREVTLALARSGVRPEGTEFPSVDVVLATPEYFGMTRREPPASARARPALVFYVTETVHGDDLPSALPSPLVRIDGGPLRMPTEAVPLADSPHHRSTLLVYHLEDIGEGGTSADPRERIEMLFPAVDRIESSGNLLAWSLPIDYGRGYQSSKVLAASAASTLTPSLTLATLLALLGGMLASMWPCLFQLTAYFIPSLAGLSMGQARASERVSHRVVQMAVFFVLGFVIVYTAAGAAIGYAAQTLGGQSVFETWRRPIMIVAALVIAGMAVRMLANARTPLVCKMPLVGHLGTGEGGTGPVGAMLLGLAYASGCMTCFGAAIALGMVTYVASIGSALYGAVTLFVFSLGMGVPLVLAAALMARVLPLLGRLERLAPRMAIASSLVMLGFAGLLLSDQYHVITSWAYRLLSS